MARKILVVALLGLLAVLPVRGQIPPGSVYHDTPVMPAGIRGQRIGSAIEAIDSGDRDRMRRFIEEECAPEFQAIAPIEAHVGLLLGLFRETGGVDFHSIRNYSPEREGVTTVILRDRNLESWRSMTFRFTEDAKALVAGLRFESAGPPSDVLEEPLTEQEAVSETKGVVERLIRRGVFSGALLIAKGRTKLLTMAGGEANRSFHVPNTVGTKFNLGSMNKMFTALAIARLAEAGKLGLDDSIGTYVDESWLPADVTAGITIRHLLTHTSGLGSYFNETFQRSSRDLFRGLDDYKPLIKDERPSFVPGSRFQYSNTGMFLLGVIIEKVTREDYFEHIRKTIYGPAGMTNSDCYEMDLPVENLAIGYSPDPESPYGWRNNLYAHVIKGGPAGGGFSTVEDLHKFALAMLSGSFVSRELLETMWTDFKGAQYGYGFRIDEGPLGRVVGHGGGFPGINSQLDIYVDAGYIVAVMSNVDQGASPLAGKIGQLLGRVRSP